MTAPTEWNCLKTDNLSKLINEERFNHVLDIWWIKPHVVNKKCCGCEEIDFSDDRFEHLQKSLNEIVETLEISCENIEFRKIVPKKLEMHSSCFEARLKISDHFVLFIPIPMKSDGGPSLPPVCSYPAFGFRLVPKDDVTSTLDLLTPGEVTGDSLKWLQFVLFDRIVRWLVKSDEQSVLRNSLKLMNIESYNDTYRDLKQKYAKHLVEIWPEVTDPLKFVYEDIAIAAYLLELWKAERKLKNLMKKQSFVDLGCGNGLLVYLLSQEGHSGLGLDLRRRKIWELFGKDTILKEQTVIPDQETLFPDSDWLIGNHSDELTPWLPVIARRSSPHCQYFVIPCCPFDFMAKYQRRCSNLSQYRCFLNYVEYVGEKCGFDVKSDVLRIPSTKRACFVGYRKNVSTDEVEINEISQSYMKKTCPNAEPSSKIAKIETPSKKVEFNAREKVEAIRNCTAIPREIMNEMLRKIMTDLLKVEDLVEVVKNEPKWNIGTSIEMSELIKLLTPDEISCLKAQCGGLKTLLRNHSHAFQVLKDKVKLKIPQSINCDTEKRKNKNCLFYEFHSSGCPLDKDSCYFIHK